jgi:CDP-diacylglycerol--glycerol-3-phosphate 3-phosphatidyltransferase
MNNLANILTMTRLALLPIMIILFFIPTQWAAWACLIVYVIGSLTDFLDGWVARKFNQITDFGKFMDPISDKIFVVTILLMLVAVDRISGISVLAVVVIIAREFLVSGIREFLGPKNIKLPVTQLAKWKTAAQMVATSLLILASFSPTAKILGSICLFAAAALTIITGWNYLKSSMKHISG